MQSIGKRTSVLALVLVIAVALLGSAYTLWSEDLSISTIASTGTLDAKVFCGVPGDNESPSWPTGASPFDAYANAIPLKDVATTPVGTANGPYQYSLSVSNTYPGYMTDCELHLTNTGSVPWHVEVESISVMDGQSTVLTGHCDAPNPYSQGNCTAGDISPTNPNGAPVYVEILDFRGCQVHQNNQKIGSLFLGVNQSAHESTTYTVVLNFRVQQWNESEWSGCGTLKPGNQPPTLPQ